MRAVTRRWPVELTGRYSVTPSTTPSTTASAALSDFAATACAASAAQAPAGLTASSTKATQSSAPHTHETPIARVEVGVTDDLGSRAEGVGFEPTVTCATMVFETIR